MKRVLPLILTVVILLLFLPASPARAQNTTCSFSQPNLYVAYWDSCSNTNRSLYGYASYNACYKYLWKVNGVVAGNTRMLTYPVTQNGTYTLCLTVTDSCRGCDTTICTTRTVSCIPNAAPCNWNTPNIYVSFWDSCTATNRSLNGYATYSGCFKYQWKVNGVIVGTTRILNYPVTQNGTYTVCLSVIDSCRRCDTTFCSTRTINCFPSATPCNWNTPNIYVSFWDSCTATNRSLNGYATYSGCFKYQWKVNGVIVGTTRILNYPVTQNGTYTVCLSVIDSCRRCDTTFCSTRTINCFPTATCRWAPATQYVMFSDSCTNTRKSLNGYAYFNPCFKYQWKVNGVIVGNTRTLNYPVTQNGTYTVCLSIIDTCRRCDTVICSTRTINCTPTSACSFAPPNLYTSFWDSCTSAGRALYGYASYNPCFKYQWKVNGVIVGSTRTLSYPVNQNGTYTVCLVVTDTCRRCDTTICSTRTIQCAPPPCQWGPNTSQYAYFWDSCTASRKSLNGYAVYNACYKYQWKVNGVIVGNTRILNYPVSQIGTYTVCLSIIDTCRRCDTTICSTRVLNCAPTVPGCQWNNNNLYTYFWDTCTVTKRSLNAYVSPNSSGYGCFKYQWRVNGVPAGNGPVLHYPVLQNGTYNVCVTILDSCRRCDTTICSTRTLHCEPNTAACNWSSQRPYVRFWDSCASTSNTYSLNGYIAFNSNTASCFRYKWLVNGQPAGSGRSLNYPITQNGTYKVCVVVTDSCRRCDTSFCSIREIGCVNELVTVPNESQLQVFENPSSGLVNVSWSPQEAATYRLFSGYGQLVQSGQLLNGTQLLDMGALPSGIYLLQVQAPGGMLTRKIFLQKY